MWDDRSVHRVTSRDACPMRSAAGAPCLLFITHGGMHYYGAPVPPGPHSMPSGEIDASDVRMPTGLADGRRTRSEAARSVRVASPPRVVAAHAAEPETYAAEPVTRAAEPVARAAGQATHAAALATEAAESTSVDETSDAVVEALTDLAEAVEKLARVLRRRAG